MLTRNCIKMDKTIKYKISNSATDLQRSQIYILYLVDFVVLIVLVVNLIQGSDFVIPFGFGLFGLLLLFTFVIRRYTSMLCEAYIDDEYLYLENKKGHDKLELSNIKSLRYHPFHFRLVTESIIIVGFYKDTEVGEKIYIYPTSLDDRKEYKSNREILKLIAEKVNEYNRAKSRKENL